MHNIPGESKMWQRVILSHLALDADNLISCVYQAPQLLRTSRLQGLSSCTRLIITPYEAWQDSRNVDNKRLSLSLSCSLSCLLRPMHVILSLCGLADQCLLLHLAVGCHLQTHQIIASLRSIILKSTHTHTHLVHGLQQVCPECDADWVCRAQGLAHRGVGVLAQLAQTVEDAAQVLCDASGVER